MKLSKLAAVIASSSVLMACLDSSDSNSQSAESKLLETNAEIAYAIYSDSVTTAKALQTALANFKAEASKADGERDDDKAKQLLIAAKAAWLVAREPYGQSEAFRFQDGPIDNETDGPEGDLNAWPLGEGLIDYVLTDTSDFSDGQVAVEGTTGEDAKPGNALELGDANGNIDGTDTAMNIIASNLQITATLFEGTSATNTDETDVITGYHAIEFLLWGQDLNSSNLGTTNTTRDDAVKAYDFEHGGQRPLADFTTNANAARRLDYLEVVVTKLVDDLTSVQTAWAPSTENYRASFVDTSDAAKTNLKIQTIIHAMGTMAYGELAGERIFVAYTDNSQEDEHSCFSDNTHRDIWLNAEGVSNLYFGDYAGYDSTLNGEDDATSNSIKGYGFDDYLDEKGLSSTNTIISNALEATRVEYTKIDDAARDLEDSKPFDVLIMDNQNALNPINTTIDTLKKEANSFLIMLSDLNLENIDLDTTTDQFKQK